MALPCFGQRSRTINKHQEIGESYNQTMFRMQNNIRVRTRGHDAFQRERQRLDSSTEYHNIGADAMGVLGMGRRRPRVPSNRLEIALRHSSVEFFVWAKIFEIAGFRVPSAVADCSFLPFWLPVMEARPQGQPCLRTQYCLAETQLQIRFKQMVLWLASVQWLCAGGLREEWIRTRLVEAAEYHGIWLPETTANRDYYSSRLKLGIMKMVATHQRAFEEALGRPGRIQLVGGSARVRSWVDEGDSNGVATLDGGGPCGKLQDRTMVYLPDLLLTRRPGLWVVRVTHDAEFARAMLQWGGVSIVRNRNEFTTGRRVRGPTWIYIAVN